MVQFFPKLESFLFHIHEFSLRHTSFLNLNLLRRYYHCIFHINFSPTSITVSVKCFLKINFSTNFQATMEEFFEYFYHLCSLEQNKNKKQSNQIRIKSNKFNITEHQQNFYGVVNTKLQMDQSSLFRAHIKVLCTLVSTN